MRSIGGFIHTMLGYLLSVVLAILIPEYIKRVIFITSVHAALFNLSAEDMEQLKLLNDRHHLLGSPLGLAFPVSISHRIWDSHEMDSMINNALKVKRHQLNAEVYSNNLREIIDDNALPAAHLATSIVKSLPYWLRYKNMDARISDIIWSAKEKMNAMA